jgi:predicted small lipoprotein YifL
MKKAAIKKHFKTITCIIILFLLTGCVRVVPLQNGIIPPQDSENKSKHSVLVVMDKASSEKVIVFKPGPFSDKFSLKGGKSIKSNVMIFTLSKFQKVDFANDFSENNGSYDYYLKIDWKDFKIDMGNSIFSKTTANLYIDYHFLNTKKEVIFTSITDGSSVNRLKGDAIVTAINPFAFVAAKKAEKLIANAWNQALANSISQFNQELESNKKKGKY